MWGITENYSLNKPLQNSSTILGSWRYALSAGLWSSVGLCSGIVLLRRIAGTFERELSGAEYFWVTSAAVTLLIAANLVASNESEVPQNSRHPRTILTLFVLMLFVAGLQPLSGLAGWLISFTAAALCSAVAWTPRSCIHLASQFEKEIEKWLPELFPPIPTRSAGSLFETSVHHPFQTDSADDHSDADVTLELIRRITSEGIAIEGSIRVEFEAGEKQTNIHIPFAPPLESTANATCHCSGEGLEVQLGGLFPYGMRLEVRRSSAVEPVISAVQFELLIPVS